MTLDLRAITGGGPAILATAMLDAKWPPMPIPAIATKFVYEVAKGMGERYCHDLMQGMLTQARDIFIAHVGEYPEGGTATERDEWAQAGSDVIEAQLEEYQAVLSSSWLYTAVDRRFDEPNVIDQLATGFANEVWRNITYYHHKTDGRPLTPAEVLLACDLDEATILSAVKTNPVSLKPQGTHMTDTHTARTIEETYARLSQNAGLLPKSEVLDILDQAADEDDSLAGSAAQALGGDMGDVANLREYKAGGLIFGAEDWEDVYQAICQACGGTYVGAEVVEVETNDDDELAAMMGLDAPAPKVMTAAERSTASPPGFHLMYQGIPSVPQPAGGVPAPAPAVAPPKPAPAAPAAPTPPAVGSHTNGQVSGEVLRLIKEATGRKSDDLGTLCGVSRATFDNYAKGKGQFVPEYTHRQNLIGLIDETVKQLQTARELLDI